ncbi:DUF3592 domain-containing protein [Vibrio splendidus]|nr:DUF3592 domain-containing protein [Vibrio splendidus]MCC4880388.1 DUF3592 domain-containing protein [Vibrio splendidus]
MFIDVAISLALLGAFIAYAQYESNEFFTLVPNEMIFAMTTALIVSAIVYYARIFLLSKARKWPSVTGKIVYVTERKGQFGDKFRITYSYEIRGIRYRGDQFDVDSCEAKYGSLKRYCRISKEDLMSKGVKGRNLKVFYNPELPSECVLDNSPVYPVILSLLPSYTVVLVSMYYLVALIIDILKNAGAI